MVKETVINFLNEISRTYLMDLKAEKHLRVEKAEPNTEEYRVALAQENVVQARITELLDTIVKLRNMTFSTNLEKVQNCLSPYKTFCDRYTMYYNLELENQNDATITQVIMCEYFNSIQDYYSTSVKLSDIAITKHQSTSIIFMYHLGIIEALKMPWYSQSKRGKMLSILNERYPNNNLISFGPNEEASKYLFNKMIFGDREERLAKIERLETAEMLQCIVYPCTCQIHEGGVNYFYENLPNPRYPNCQSEPTKAYFTINEVGDYVRASVMNKVIKENKEYVDMAKKLMGQ